MPAVKESTLSNKSVTELASSPYYNQGTSLSLNARAQLGLQGRVPAGVESIDLQKQRALKMLRSKSSALENYIFTAQLRNSNSRLFYSLVSENLEEFAPIVYTPGVGEACVEYSNIYPFLGKPPGAPDGLYISWNDLPNIKEVLRNYQSAIDPDITVISDGSRILGLGDLGVGGIGIPIGKLQLYTAGAGIDPRKTLPIILDFGTNTDRYLNDPHYLGLRQKRPADKEFYAAVDQVMNALYELYPDILVQFEDFSTDHAFGLLEKYQDKTLCFNDDIQGTGSVILAGFINAVRKVEKETKVKDHRIVFFGAGSSAIGVAKQIQSYFIKHRGMSEEESKKVFYFVDSKGLVTLDRGDTLAQHKVYFARSDNPAQFKTLCDVIDYAQPTVLIGLSAQYQAFTAEALKKMAAINDLPVIFPLSNPMTNAECTFEEAMRATGERAIFASGTAFPPYRMANGELKTAGQGNNMYIFPGLGLGTIVSKTSRVSDAMVYEAAKGLSTSLVPDELKNGDLYPSLTRIRDVSAEVAAAVCRQALAEGLARDPTLLRLAKTSRAEDELQKEIVAFVKSKMWDPADERNFDLAAQI
ncbi:hypothetical protein DFQ30_009867 [Apophysomyces sp. BC1015]|nr:hypothetical protein DFQ30_009867 [Apophysomyces sp. BC1015]KAG0177232.1 hypothetical protein DFQ29_005074 [Apophysomyces sp. BC1021]